MGLPEKNPVKTRRVFWVSTRVSEPRILMSSSFVHHVVDLLWLVWPCSCGCSTHSACSPSMVIITIIIIIIKNECHSNIIVDVRNQDN